ncbi:hypothetical protein D4764_12G0008430 [Takifugu flavidus]|uniref:Uncharacterized protein n=1 Tax=Takifugu flavidus TaxID=433684 RepID=A0A5C6PDC1_9TELE|nr:hypothetical protein D4764_12G0008430 [Takifugu flavidus]
MGKDYWSASKEFRQTVRRLRRGKQCSANTLHSVGGDLLTSTGDTVRWRKDYFEELLNPVVTPSTEEVEPGGCEEDSAKVTNVVSQLFSGKAPGVEELHPEFLKFLDVSEVSALMQSVYQTFMVKKVERWSSRFASQSAVLLSPMVMNFGESEKLSHFGGHLPSEVFQVCPPVGGPKADPGHSGKIVFQLAWKCLGILSEVLEEVPGESEVRASLLRLLPLQPSSR